MSKRRVLSKGVLDKLAKDAEAARLARLRADELTAAGFPVGHPLRTLCLLASGPAGRSQYVFEQTESFLKRKP